MRHGGETGMDLLTCLYHPGCPRCPCGDTTPDAPANIPGPDAPMPVWRNPWIPLQRCPHQMTPSDNNDSDRITIELLGWIRQNYQEG
jgi:hypothetical protein